MPGLSSASSKYPLNVLADPKVLLNVLADAKYLQNVMAALIDLQNVYTKCHTYILTFWTNYAVEQTSHLAFL